MPHNGNRLSGDPPLDQLGWHEEWEAKFTSSRLTSSGLMG